MTTMANQAATFMAPGKGVLVLDDYALAAVTSPTWPGLTFERYIDMVMHSAALAPYISAVVVSPETVLATQPQPRGIGLGVRMPIGNDRAPGDLRRRLRTLSEQGVALAEFRSNLPVARVQRGSTHTDAEALTEGATAALDEGITPILTVAMPALESHSQAVTHAATANALGAVFASLAHTTLDPAAILLRVNMIIPGEAHTSQPTPAEVASSTLEVLTETVHPDLGGVILMSSGQSLDLACRNLRAIGHTAHTQSSRWPITFGFTRAVVEASLDVQDNRDERGVHDGLLRACERASQSASGADSFAPL